MKNYYIGVNYWDSVSGTDMWVNFDESVVDADLEALSRCGVNTLRIFPNWRDFQPVTTMLAPHPNLHVLGSNMRFFTRSKTVGMYPEGAHNTRGADMSELKSWILAKLEWDPDFDVEKGTEEFIAAYCGAGAEPILRYINALNQRAEDIQSHRTCYACPDREFFSPEFMAFAIDCFAEAKRKAENDEVLERIQRWEMSIRYVDLFLYHDKYDDEQLEKEKERFLSDMERLGISYINEGTCGENNRRMLENHFRNVRPQKDV